MSLGVRPSTASAYEAVLGERIDELHPRLRTYFSAVPVGHVGRGRGTFDRVGTPRRWAWPVLALLQRGGVAFPGDERDVRFDVVNTPVQGRSAVRAERVFWMSAGPVTMRDTISAIKGRLVDDVGHGGVVRAVFDARVVDGALLMRSTRLGLRFGGLRMALPRAIAPRITLRERFDDDAGVQRVDCDVSLPIIGSIYGYRGRFVYEMEKV